MPRPRNLTLHVAHQALLGMLQAYMGASSPATVVETSLRRLALLYLSAHRNGPHTPALLAALNQAEAEARKGAGLVYSFTSDGHLAIEAHGTKDTVQPDALAKVF